MRLAWQIDGIAVKEDVMHEARRIGYRQRASHGGKNRQRPVDRPEGGMTYRFGKDHFLAQKTVEQRHSGHGSGCHDRQR